MLGHSSNITRTLRSDLRCLSDHPLTSNSRDDLQDQGAILASGLSLASVSTDQALQLARESAMSSASQSFPKETIGLVMKDPRFIVTCITNPCPSCAQQDQNGALPGRSPAQSSKTLHGPV